MKKEEIHIRDPFIYVENGIYYLLGTTGDDPWGKASTLMLYRSFDSVEFETVGCMVDYSILDGYTNVWAPELHKYDGKYYLIVSLYREDLGRGSIILTANGLQDKFVFLTGEYITPTGWGCLDATLFVYCDTPYLCFSNEWMTPITGDGDGALFLAELSRDLTKTISKPRKIVSGKYCGFSEQVSRGDVVGYVAEGPWLYEKDGNVVLLWSTFTKTGYSVVKSVCKGGLSGEFEFEKLVFKENGGHCMRFTDLQGRAHVVLHQPDTTPSERMKIFDEEK